MKKFILLITVLILLLGLYLLNSFTGNNNSHEQDKKNSPNAEGPVLEKINTTDKKSLFVPYWSFTGKIDSNGYDELVYFGITANKIGINKDDPGFSKIPSFTKNTKQNTNKILAVRLLDQDLNSSILKNSTLGEKIINESIDVAKNNSFNGILLDFEVNGIPFESFTKSITNYFQIYSKICKANNLVFYVSIYGDTFYRLRPYDLISISNVSDRVFVTAYDFHKAGGNPGPNFPLSGKEIYGYDFMQMVDDFKKFVPSEKLTVIFGMYGYDWTIDNEQRSVMPGLSISLNVIKAKFYPNCSLIKCQINRDKKSSEINITYQDNDSKNHVVWFEDNESVNRKIKYLRDNNIKSFAYWAYSYY